MRLALAYIYASEMECALQQNNETFENPAEDTGFHNSLELFEIGSPFNSP